MRRYLDYTITAYFKGSVRVSPLRITFNFIVRNSGIIGTFNFIVRNSGIIGSREYGVMFYRRFIGC